MFFGGEKEIRLLRVLPAWRPKCFAFRHPPAHQHSKNDYQSFSWQALPSQGSNPYCKKKRYNLSVIPLFWRRERDSNPWTGLTVTRFPVVRLRPTQPSLRMLTLLLYTYYRKKASTFFYFFSYQKNIYIQYAQNLICTWKIMKVMIKSIWLKIIWNGVKKWYRKK